MATASAKHRPQGDIYSRERSAIIERLETGLHLHAPWRDPREAGSSGGFRADPTPWAHTLAGACVWLRRNTTGRHDVSADLLWCIVMQERCEAEMQRVVSALVAAWLDMHGPVATLARTPSGLAAVEHAAAKLTAQIVTGQEGTRKVRIHWQIWRKMQESGERMLWGLAETAIRRAMAALR